MTGRREHVLPGLRVEPDALAGLVRDVEQRYPTEACGWLVGEPGRATRAEPLQNVLARGDGCLSPPAAVVDLGQPLARPRSPSSTSGVGASPGRSARAGFVVDDGEHLALLRRLDAAGERALAFYHSHCDAPAELSPLDRAGVGWGMTLVAAVYRGRAGEVAAYRPDPAAPNGFERHDLALEPR